MFKIKLLEHTGSDMAISNYARQSFTNPGDIHEVPEGYTEKSALGIVDFCGRNGHSTPFRHPTVTISMSIPMFLARQIGKHQMGFSWSEKSMRYTTDPKFWVVDEWRAAADSVKQGSGGVHHESIDIANTVAKGLKSTVALYESLIRMKIAPELARSILPQSMMVDVVWTGSLLGFAFMCKQRLDDHAQLEAQWFAQEVQAVLEPLFPKAWKSLMAPSPEAVIIHGLEQLLKAAESNSSLTDGQVLDEVYSILGVN